MLANNPTKWKYWAIFHDSFFWFLSDLQPITSQRGFTSIIEFSSPWKRWYYKYATTASRRDIAKGFCQNAGFQLVKMDVHQWTNKINQVVDYSYWVDARKVISNQYQDSMGKVVASKYIIIYIYILMTMEGHYKPICQC